MQRDIKALQWALLRCNKCLQSAAHCHGITKSAAFAEESACFYQKNPVSHSMTGKARYLSRFFSSLPAVDNSDQSDDPCSSAASESIKGPKDFNGSRLSLKGNGASTKQSKKKYSLGQKDNGKDTVQSRFKDSRGSSRLQNDSTVKKSFSRNSLTGDNVKPQSPNKKGQSSQYDVTKSKHTKHTKKLKNPKQEVDEDEDEEEEETGYPYENDESIDKFFTPLTPQEKERRIGDLHKAYLEVSASRVEDVKSEFEASKIASIWNKAYENRAHSCGLSEGKPIENDQIVSKPSDLEANEEEDEQGLATEIDQSSDQWAGPVSPEETEFKILELHRSLLEASLEENDEEVSEQVNAVKKEDQKSLTVGIIGVPNAGKSTLTNYMVGTKIAAVSRKTNTTDHEILGVLTKDETQILFYDTPGLAMRSEGVPYNYDIRQRVESCWKNLQLYDLLVILIDVNRHISRRDPRVIKLVETMGQNVQAHQKRVLCLNKVDLVEKKEDLLTAASEFGKLPGYDRFFMISGQKGSGVKDLVNYLMDQAVKRPWDEDPVRLDEDYVKNLSYEVVREKILEYLHQEIPYTMDHRVIDLNVMEDGSLKIEHHLIVHKRGHRKIVVGKGGSKIRQIGMAANEELRNLLKKTIHLILQVRLKE